MIQTGCLLLVSSVCLAGCLTVENVKMPELQSGCRRNPRTKGDKNKPVHLIVDGIEESFHGPCAGDNSDWRREQVESGISRQNIPAGLCNHSRLLEISVILINVNLSKGSAL